MNTRLTESSTIQAALLDLLAKTESGWTYISGDDLDRELTSAIIESDVRDALINLNPALKSDPSNVDLVIPRIRALLLSAPDDGLVKANEQAISWLAGREAVELPPDGDPQPISFFDFDNPRSNRLVVSDEVTFVAGADERRYDVVLWINGFPLVVGETKTPFDANKSWITGAEDIHDYYEPHQLASFVPNVLNFASDGKELRYAPIHTPPEMWLPWGRTTEPTPPSGMKRALRAAELLLTPELVLDILRSFTLYSAPEGRAMTFKVIPRYPQVEAVEAIVERANDPDKKQGLIWHHQGSGKTFLAAFACGKLRRAIPGCTVVVLLDRLDLIDQVTAEFRSAGVDRLAVAETKEQVRSLLGDGDGHRGVVISTIFRFAEAGELTDRDDVVVIVDEAHRTQEGSLGQDLRLALPKATYIGMTGTPISDIDRDTFKNFGDPDDPDEILNAYPPERSIEDGATLPIRVEAPLPDLVLKTDQLDQAFDDLAEEEGLTEEEKELLARKASNVKPLLRAQKRIDAVAADIVEHFYTRIEPLGLKAQVVVYDRELCVSYHDAISKELEKRVTLHGQKPEATVVMTVSGGKGDKPEFLPFKRDRQEEADVKNRFKDFRDPLQLVIVTAKLLTGFDAPIEGVLYIDKPLRKHTLFQAMTRTNRRWTNPDTGQEKTVGLIVDYIGLGKQIAEAVKVNKKYGASQELELDVLIEELASRLDELSEQFRSVDRDGPAFQALMDAQEILKTEDSRKQYAQDFLTIEKLWELLWPIPDLKPLRDEYKWFAKLYKSIQPSEKPDALLWHRLGAKTLELVNEHIVGVTVRSGETEKITIDEETLKALRQLELPIPDPEDDEQDSPDADEILDSIEKRIRARLSKDPQHAKYKSLADRLEKLKDATVSNAAESIEWLKEILELARQVVEVGNDEDGPDTPGSQEQVGLLPEDRTGALTQIFLEYKPDATPEIIDRVVGEIDVVVEQIKWTNWQVSSEGERAVRKAIRQALKKYDLPITGDLYEKAYDYVAEHY